MINKFIFRNFVPACMVACAVVMGVMAPSNSFAQKAKAQCLSAIAANEKIVSDYERQKADSKPADKIA